VTVRLYLEDAYLREAEALVTGVRRSRGRRAYVALDRTVFHPLSGGQPSDRGYIVAGQARFRVKKAIVSGGEILHYGVFEEGSLEPGDRAVARIDWELRYLVMRLHTAGHILDYAVSRVHGEPPVTLSAFHGPGAYLEYRLSGEPRLGEIEGVANRVVREDRPVRIYSVPPGRLGEVVYGAPNLGRLPPAREYRIVEIVGVNAMPCTGTHVRRTGEVGRIVLERAEPTGRGWKVYYGVEG